MARAGKHKVDRDGDRTWLERAPPPSLRGDITDADNMFLDLRQKIDDAASRARATSQRGVLSRDGAAIFRAPVVEGLGKSGLTKQGEKINSAASS